MPRPRTPRGLEWQQGTGQWMLTARCDHQAGKIYIVGGADMNWVCSNLARPSHSLAGFFRELVEMDDPRIKALLQRWGIYYRPLPLEEAAEK